MLQEQLCLQRLGAAWGSWRELSGGGDIHARFDGMVRAGWIEKGHLIRGKCGQKVGWQDGQTD